MDYSIPKHMQAYNHHAQLMQKKALRYIERLGESNNSSIHRQSYQVLKAQQEPLQYY